MSKSYHVSDDGNGNYNVEEVDNSRFVSVEKYYSLARIEEIPLDQIDKNYKEHFGTAPRTCPRGHTYVRPYFGCQECGKREVALRGPRTKLEKLIAQCAAYERVTGKKLDLEA